MPFFIICILIFRPRQYYTCSALWFLLWLSFFPATAITITTLACKVSFLGKEIILIDTKCLGALEYHPIHKH